MHAVRKYKYVLSYIPLYKIRGLTRKNVFEIGKCINSYAVNNCTHASLDNSGKIVYLEKILNNSHL